VCQNFAVHAGTVVTFGGGITTILGGDVGGTSITGVELGLALKDGITSVNSASFNDYVVSAYYAAIAISSDINITTTEIGGMTFTPGTHRFDSAINLASGSSVTLDGNNEMNPKFLFQAGTNLVTAESTYVILKNGAKARNILWALGSAANLGAGSVLEGSILAGTAITFGAQSELRGCALALSDVTFESAGSVNLRSQPSPVCTDGSLSQSVCQNFAVHARTTVTFADGYTVVNGGDVGVSPGTNITGLPTIQNGAVSTNSTDFAFSVLFAHAAAIAQRFDSEVLDIEIGGKTFMPGTYRSGSAINLASGSNVTLDGNNEMNPKFLFQAGTTLVTAASTYVILKNGAKAENILWALGSAATLGAASVLEGSILAGTAITFGDQTELRGCAIAMSAVTFPSAGSVLLPKASPSNERSWSADLNGRPSSGSPSKSGKPSGSPSNEPSQSRIENTEFVSIDTGTESADASEGKKSDENKLSYLSWIVQFFPAVRWLQRQL
jgi:hypothetical protein